MNTIKQGSSDYTQDLTELEHHTTRMYELIVNMIQRSVYLKDHAVKEVADKLESKESIITDLQQQTHQLKQELGLKSEEIESFVQRVADYEEKLKANGAMLETNQALISEYKDKNDTLNGLVVKYQAYADENEELKRLFKVEKAEIVKQATDEKAVVEAKALHNEEVRKLYDEMAGLRKANEELRERMQSEIEQLKQENQDKRKEK